MFNFQSPAESAVLAQLEGKCQELLAYLRMYPQDRVYPAAQLEELLRNLGRWEQVFMGFAPQAQQLSMMGYGQLSQRLNFVLNDLRNVTGIYRQMYDNALRTQQKQQDIWTNARNDGLRNMQRAGDYARSVSTTWVQDMMALNEKRCLYCDNYIGTSDGICPDCERKRRLMGL